jgi:hypothetical protein
MNMELIMLGRTDMCTTKPLIRKHYLKDIGKVAPVSEHLAMKV